MLYSVRRASRSDHCRSPAKAASCSGTWRIRSSDVTWMARILSARRLPVGRPSLSSQHPLVWPQRLRRNIQHSAEVRFLRRGVPAPLRRRRRLEYIAPIPGIKPHPIPPLGRRRRRVSRCWVRHAIVLGVLRGGHERTRYCVAGNEVRVEGGDHEGSGSVRRCRWDSGSWCCCCGVCRWGCRSSSAG